MSVCPFFSLVVFKRTVPGTTVMARLRCKSWQCDHCARLNRDMWRSHLKKRIGRMGGQWWFLTMTAHEHIRTPAGSLANIRNNLDRLFKRVRRVWGKIEYVRVYETHEKGAFHVHLVISGLSARVVRKMARNGQIHYKPGDTATKKGSWGVQTWFRRNCREIGMGYMVHCVQLDTTAKTVNYVCKYLTKTAQDFVMKGLRRVQTSQGIGSPNKRGDGTWTVQPVVFRGNIGADRLYDSDLRAFVPDEYWREHITYPITK